MIMRRTVRPVASALRSSGSTTRWRKLRAVHAAAFAEVGVIPCWRCGQLVSCDEPWALGHVVDRALGGDDSQLAIEHLQCSRRSGWELGRRLKAARADPTVYSDSDDLFPVSW